MTDCVKCPLIPSLFMAVVRKWRIESLVQPSGASLGRPRIEAGRFRPFSPGLRTAALCWSQEAQSAQRTVGEPPRRPGRTEAPTSAAGSTTSANRHDSTVGSSRGLAAAPTEAIPRNSARAPAEFPFPTNQDRLLGRFGLWLGAICDQSQ
jgi:hypothetical protein